MRGVSADNTLQNDGGARGGMLYCLGGPTLPYVEPGNKAWRGEAMRV